MEILKLKESNLDVVLEKSVGVLKSGGVVVLPTDTVYGIMADARDSKAVAKIFKIKSRNENKPISIFVRDLGMLKEYADFSENLVPFFKKIWPGRVTVVLKSKSGVLGDLVGKNGTVGVRIPGGSFILELLDLVDFPIAQTSVNISGMRPAKDFRKVLEYFESEKLIELGVDGGVLNGEPSTVLDLTSGVPLTLREGAVSSSEIKKVFIV